MKSIAFFCVRVCECGGQGKTTRKTTGTNFANDKQSSWEIELRRLAREQKKKIRFVKRSVSEPMDEGWC